MIKITQHKNMLNVDERWDLIIYGKNTFFLPIILVQDCDYYFYHNFSSISLVRVTFRAVIAISSMLEFVGRPRQGPRWGCLTQILRCGV